MATEDTNLGNGDQGPWTDHVVHRVIAYGSFAATNATCADPDAAGTKGAPVYYDGYRWRYMNTIWKRQDGGLSTFRLTVKSTTVTLEIDNHGATPTTNQPLTVARTYTGPFNRLSMVMGNCEAKGIPASVDNIMLRDGLVQGHADFDGDGDVDQADFGLFQVCLSGTNLPFAPECAFANLDGDSDVDGGDFDLFQKCMRGPDIPYDPNCTN